MPKGRQKEKNIVRDPHHLIQAANASQILAFAPNLLFMKFLDH